MTAARDGAKRNFINALKPLVVEGRPCDWVKAMILLAIPITFSFSLAALLNSIIGNLFVPMIWSPVVNAMGIKDLAQFTVGALRIGAMLVDATSVCIDVIMLFALTRLIRRFL